MQGLTPQQLQQVAQQQAAAQHAAAQHAVVTQQAAGGLSMDRAAAMLLGSAGCPWPSETGRYAAWKAHGTSTCEIY